jgi:hypothetical protein
MFARRWPLRRAGLPAAAVVITTYFLYFNAPSLRARFTPDDLMNCHMAWSRPTAALLGDHVVFWRPTPVYRPLGALAYKLSFLGSGFDLRPLRLLLLGALGAAVWLTYVLARRLSGSEEAGLLAALLAAYHGNTAHLLYNTGTLYDIFCLTFYLAAIAYYVRLRQRGGPASLRQAAVFGGLMVLAFNSKEMAVSLAPMALLYDLLFHPPRGARPPEAARWAFTEARLSVAGCLLTAGWVAGRLLGPDSISAQAGYQLAISPIRYFEGAAHFLNQLFYSAVARSGTDAFLILTGLLAGALLVRSRALVWCWLLFACGILPLVFLTSPRGLDAAVIPLAGLWMYAAALAVRLRETIVRLVADAAPAEWSRGPAAASPAALFVLAAVLLLRIHPGSEPVYQAWVRHHYGRIASVTAQFRELYPALPRGSRVLIVKDPFGDFTWETYYILQLLYRDETMVINRLGMMNPKPDRAALASYDHIFSFENGRVVELAATGKP